MTVTSFYIDEHVLHKNIECFEHVIILNIDAMHDNIPILSYICLCI